MPDMMKRVDVFLEFCCFCHTIYLYGAGRFGRETLVFLREHGIEVAGFLVTDHNEAGRDVLGVPVREIAGFCNECGSGIVLCIGRRYRKEMQTVLKARGINRYYTVGEELLAEIEQQTAYTEVFPSNQHVNVLLYHRVAEVPKDDWNIAVSPHHFREQMSFLVNHYPIVRLGDDWSRISQPSVVVTFDDGYRDNYEHALPVLEEFGIPATFFVSTGLLGKEEYFWWDMLSEIFAHAGAETVNILGKDIAASEIRLAHDMLNGLPHRERMSVLGELQRKYGLTTCVRDRARCTMSERELRELAAAPGVDIGAHTVTHSSLAALDETGQEREICQSKERLESILGKPVDFFSYPFGLYDKHTPYILQRHGFKLSPTVSAGLTNGGQPYEIHRNAVPDVGAEAFQKFLRRIYCVFAEVRP